jgi:type I restriction-modification system DNA methylase subunit
MSALKTALQALAAQAKANNIHRMAEMQVQSSYVIKVLELLGWKDSDWKLGAAQGTNTGKFPDISLHDRNKHTVLVVECKDAKKSDKLDGRYGAKTFEQQLYGYCRAEGINWGILTNFVEWRLYNDVQERLYQNKKYAFLDLLWPGANPKSYVDILSDEGLAFLMKFQRTPLCHAKGRVDDDPLYYPIEKQVEDIKAKFFVKLKGWRDSLRRELHKNYWEKYDKDQIDLFTQKILDRMIFMEVCHDKGIIGQDVHRAILSSKDDKYHELKKWFQEMDEQFNTELFAPMAIDHFDIDDKALVPIIEELNGIDFKNVSVHIIGEVYENYLGEMLRVTKKSGLKVQEHKEQAKRKSQGIYYTPEYIVDYIVKNTVGELVKKAKTEDDLKQIKILDPACGSGSFLIKAFDVMYQAYEKLKIDRNKGQLETGKDLKIKRLILQHNLYGVDLDDRAVEITKLNLMLKALEGFNFHELKGRKLLPNLNLNIRVGNSLISGQTIEQLAEKQAQTTIPGLDDVVDIKPLLKLHTAFYKEVEDEEKARLIREIEVEERRLNRKLGDNLKGYFSNLEEVKPLNYQVAFPEVFSVGGPSTGLRHAQPGSSGQGFDAVIGNPPYGNLGNALEQKYLKIKMVGFQGVRDVYVAFYERSVELLRKDGLLGFITPVALASGPSYKEIRKILLIKTHIRNIINLPFDVFKDAYIDAGIFLMQKGAKGITHTFAFDKKETLTSLNDLQIKWDKHDQTKWLINDDYKFEINIKASQLLDRIKSRTKVVFGDVCNIKRGILYENDKKVSVNTKGSLPAFEGSVYRYECIKNEFENAFIFGTNLKECPKDIKWFLGKRILLRRLVNRQKRLMAALVNKDFIVKKDLYVILPNDNIELEVILGILNSSLYSYLYIQRISTATKDDYPQVTIVDVKALPYPNNIDNETKSKLVRLVREIHKLNKTPEIRPLPGPPRIGEGKRADIAVIDQEIDELVYRLYGLGEAEKKEIER